MIPLTYIKFILFALCVAAPGSKFVKSTKIDPPALRGLGNNELMITPPTDPSLPMKKPLHGNKKQHGQMNQDLAGTNDPPYRGTIFIDGNIITDTGPNSLQMIEIYDDMQCTMIFDRRTNSFTKSSNTHIFKATFSDGIITQFWLRSTDYTRDQAKQQVLKYAKYLGRVPQFIRLNMRVATIQAGDEAWGGSGEGIVTIHADHDYSHQGENGGDITEETLVHEGAHITIDNPVYADSAWDDAVNADDAFISFYAKDYPRREDVAESLPLWVGIALGTLNSDDADITSNQIPNRLSYFDNQGYNLFPLGDGIGGEVPGYEWKKLDNRFYYPCGSWEGGAKSVIYTSPTCYVEDVFGQTLFIPGAGVLGAPAACFRVQLGRGGTVEGDFTDESCSKNESEWQSSNGNVFSVFDSLSMSDNTAVFIPGGSNGFSLTFHFIEDPTVTKPVLDILSVGASNVLELEVAIPTCSADASCPTSKVLF